jgi:hypothetical protein
MNHANSPDLRLTLIKGADHRFSDAACLQVLRRTLDDLEE